MSAAATIAEDAALLSTILALILPPGADPTALAQALLKRFGTAGAVFAADADELSAVADGRLQVVVTFPLLREAAIRLMRTRIRQGSLLASHDALMAYLQAVLARETLEQFRVLFLDRNARLIADEVLAQGTIDQTPVYPREVMRRAIRLKASELILVHNHPGWNPMPSREDIMMTRRLEQIATVLGLTVRDHVIVGNGGATSFRQAGLL
ncbi:DNA repair protein RadC [Gluconacetobacter aggeris]|uniref:DNA repair protein RadC n=1 Tax=Gluconacetobacter aggeris TaxID=1286186 RepID=A0A7W4NW49_9PROT|nr:DNA repair protein RadC [Gluconacetobacter aggeris]MBB2168476.1 DNA repair protein RadC [Gluconacetobacter aggeris]